MKLSESKTARTGTDSARNRAARLVSLLGRKAWIERRIDDLQRQRSTSNLVLLRLKTAKLLVERRLQDALRQPARPAVSFA